MIRIFMVDGIPSQNKGEIAILEGVINSLQNIDEVEVAVLSHRPDIDTPRYPLRARTVDATKALPLYSESRNGRRIFRIFWSISFILQHLLFLISYTICGLRALRFMNAEIWKTYIESDVIMAHDGSFGIGGGKPGLPIYSFLLYLPFFAKTIRKPMVLYGVSINKPYRFYPIINKIYRYVLNRTSLITLREEVSYHYLREIGVQDRRIFMTADPAFLLEASPLKRVQEIMRLEGIEQSLRPIIGMTVTREIASGISSDRTVLKDNYDKHVAMFAWFIDEITTKFDANIVFLPHCTGFNRELDDRIVAKDVLSKCKNQEKVRLITNEYGAAEMKGLMGQFDLFVGERMHALIGAMSMGVPSLAILFSTDLRSGIVTMMEQEDCICQAEELTGLALISRVSNIWSRKAAIRENLRSQTEIMKKRAMLNGKLLEELLDL